MSKKSSLRQALEHRILLLDGGMGSMIQEYNLTEDDFRGTAFVTSQVPLKGNNDVLSLTRPDVISEIHHRYLEAGADIITTNTFSSQVISQKDYGLTAHVDALNRASATLARQEADRMTALTPSQPRFVVGDIGPTSKMLSMSEDVNDPASRAVTFDQVEAAYLQQMRVLLECRVDAVLVETIFDTLNAKAAISAFIKAKEEFANDEYVPEIMLSMTVSDSSGRTLSGQTIEAFVISVEHCSPLSLGLNCGLGASGMLPYLRQMSRAASCFISCHPNAGLPNQFGTYDDTPDMMVGQMRSFISENLANIIGGCCGTTPAHIAAMRQLIDEGGKPHAVHGISLNAHRLSGLEPSIVDDSTFFNVGERCNVAGSRKFLRLISEKNYDEALDIARKQVEDGAMAIDINMDDGLLDAKAEMREFVNLLASDPEISKVPLMIDSSRFDVIEEGLKCCQGKCIVNSISLKMGEEGFLAHAKVVKRLGAAIIVMCFDEDGQATDYEHRVKICSRAYKLLTETVGFNPSDIIFDPNVLTIATGIAEHNNYALDFIRATEWIHDNLPGARVSGGLSNLSFAFRGNNILRESMHAVFLYHAIQKGMSMAIMNPATAVAYQDIPADLRKAIEDVVLNTYPEATERLTEFAAVMLAEKERQKQAKENGVAAEKTTEAVNLPADQRLINALVKGNPANLEHDLVEALETFKTPLAIISGPLMEGMNQVGLLFGEGKMFLPQVIKTARTMKKAVEILQPLIEKEKAEAGSGEGAVASRPRILIATVKGDVHDIGKNIVGIVLACNNFDVIDLGVMVPSELIVEKAISKKADFVCLSGLITPSLDEMCTVAKALEAAGLSIPMFVGGATTSPVHTAVKIAPLYSGPVFHTRDASQNPILASKLLDPAQRDEVIAENRVEQARIREAQLNKPVSGKTADYDLAHRVKIDWSDYKPVCPPFIGKQLFEFVPVSQLVEHIDWTYFFWAWRVKAESEVGMKLKDDALSMLEQLRLDPQMGVNVIKAFYPSIGTTHSIKVTMRRDGHADNCPCCQKVVELETPRKSKGEERPSLCDYVSPDHDFVGAFAATVSPVLLSRLESLKQTTDDYQSILLQTLCDRLVEAGAELMSNHMAEAYGWHGIRPAIGYPSLPDQKQIFKVAEMIDFAKVGISLTENGAMYPQSSVCGILISNAQSKYF